jgi:hypothetical protein
MEGYVYFGRQGAYWIRFDALPDGRVKASASRPVGGRARDVASTVAETAARADELLIAQLYEMGA